jgi:hypothetical protein
VRIGGNTRLLRKRSRVRFPQSEKFCMNMSVCIGSGASMYNMYVITKKMYISMYLSVI